MAISAHSSLILIIDNDLHTHLMCTAGATNKPAAGRLPAAKQQAILANEPDESRIKAPGHVTTPSGVPYVGLFVGVERDTEVGAQATQCGRRKGIGSYAMRKACCGWRLGYVTDKCLNASLTCTTDPAEGYPSVK